MNLNFRDEIWFFVISGVALAALAVGAALLLHGNGVSGLNLPG